jgi:hypothetical protein
MDEDRFWQLIEQSRVNEPDCEEQTEVLVQLLQRLGPEEILEFDRSFLTQTFRAYRWDIRAVAYIINGGASDDSFEYFRCWLIAQGKEFFEAVLEQPEKAAERVKDDGEWVECEDILYAAGDAYEKKTGQPFPGSDIDYPLNPIGVRWKEEDLDRLYPRLCERFG